MNSEDVEDGQGIEAHPSYDKIREHLQSASRAIRDEELGYAVDRIRWALQSLDRIEKVYVVVPKWRAEGLLEADAERAAKEKLRARIAHMTRKVPREVRAAVLLRDHGLCRYCGTAVEGREAQMDHYDPNGPGTISNLVTACRPCNIRKGPIHPRSLPKRRNMKLLGKGVQSPPPIEESIAVAAVRAEAAAAAEVEAARIAAEIEAARRQPGSPLRVRQMTPEEIETEIVSVAQLVFSPSQVAGFFGISEEHVIEAVNQGDLRGGWLIGTGRKRPKDVRIHKDEVLRIVHG